MRNIRYLLLLIILLPTIVLANDNYNIASCDTEITFANDNEYTSSENIDFNFNKENTLVTKTLPINTKNILVDKDYFLATENESKIIKIYSNEFDKRSYSIRYTIKNDNKESNKVNICSNYNGNISNINFRLDLPNTISEDNIKFYINNIELTDISFYIDNKTVIGNYPNLKETDTLSFSINYDEIYYGTYTIMCIIIPIIFALISALIWFFYGRDSKYKINRISKLPKSISLLDIALVNDGEVTEEEAFYLLLDLANRGYLEIVENKNNTFTIIRKKDYDGKNYIEASFIKALFRKTLRVTISEYVEVITDNKNHPIKELVNEISDDNLKANFKRACNNILGLINANEEKDKYFEQKSDSKKLYLIAMIAIILVLVTSLPFIEMNKLFLLPLAVIFSVIVLYILLYFVSIINLKNKKNRIEIIIILAISTMIIMLFPSFNHNKLYIISFVISIICVAIILFFYKYMPKRTIYGTKVYSKIEGFKLYLEELRDEDLKALLDQSPDYLIDILPISYILDEGQLVINKMKKQKKSSPEWYKIDDYTPTRLHNSIMRLKNKIIIKDEEI